MDTELFNASMKMESAACDAANMAGLLAYIIDGCTDREMLAFAACHTATLAEKSRDQWYAVQTVVMGAASKAA